MEGLLSTGPTPSSFETSRLISVAENATSFSVPYSKSCKGTHMFSTIALLVVFLRLPFLEVFLILQVPTVFGNVAN